MSRFLILLILVCGLVVETTLRLTVFLAIALTVVGMAFLCWEDTAELVVKPSLYPLVTKALED